MNEARNHLVAVVTWSAEHLADFLDQHPVPATASYPMLDVHSVLTEHHATLAEAVKAYPLALAVDTNGRLDKLGAEIAKLAASLAYAVVYYRNLDDIPAALRPQAGRDLDGLARDANSVVAIASRG